MGTWIETADGYSRRCRFSSSPTWGRGLKLLQGQAVAHLVESSPTWGRGLKHQRDRCLR